MSSDSDLADLIQLGEDITAFKFYMISVAALWVYDYFLTVCDEIRYAWKTESVVALILFLFTRYLPPVFLVWSAISSLYPGYTSEMCAKTAFLEIMYYTVITAIAQIVLTQRTYAITGKNKWIAGTLCTLSVALFVVGVYMFIQAALRPAAIAGVPLDSYHVCLIGIERPWVVAQIALSLVFDIAVFVLVIGQAQLIKSKHRGMGGPSILDTVSRDAGIYFAVVASSHLVIVVMFFAARPTLRPIPVVGNTVLIPMMMSRMIISLKKVASSRQPHVNLELPSGLRTNLHDSYAPHPVENIPLSKLKG